MANREDPSTGRTTRGEAEPASVFRPVSPTILFVDSESELVARLCDGDEHAFVTVVQLYQQPMLRLARSMVDDAAVAEEAVQDTWMSVVKGIERFEARSTLKTWLFRILVNRVRSAHAGESRRRANRGPSVDPACFDSSGQWSQPVLGWDGAADCRVGGGRVS